MENIDGALAFKATLDIDDFDVSAEAMERRIKRVSTTTMSEADMMDQSMLSFAQNGAKYIATYLVSQGLGGLLQSIVSTRGQFQQLEISFETMLGSGTKAHELMAKTAHTAASTPFDLIGVAGGIKQLLAYGESANTVNDTLVRLGNIASGLSIPLNDIVYLYGTTMTQGRLFTQDVRQFMGRGIPLVKELSAQLGKTEEEINEMVTAGKIGFPEVEKVIQKMTNSGGQFYNLMAKQSKSLTGMISNMGDAWDSSLNKIGTDNQDVFAAGISGATYMAEHLDDILRILKAVTIAYGSYKAAIVFNTIATKGYTGIALVDNTVRQAKIALLKADAQITGQAAAQTKAMTAAQNAHTVSLQKQLTVEEQSNLTKRLRVATIQQLLTAQQQEYLSNLNLTTSSANYEAVAMGVLTVEQKEALSKTDLSTKSAIYRTALEQEVASKVANQTASLNAMRSEVKAAAVKMESARANAIAAQSAVDRGNLEVYMANKSGDATRLAAAEKKLEGAVDNASIARKAALAAQSDFYAKKKNLETLATKQSTLASVADTTAKGTQSVATTVFTAVTTKATMAVKALWLTMKTNPLGWILTIVGLVISAISLFSKKSEEATTVEGEFQDATRKSGDELKTYMAILQNAEKGTDTHRKALDKINSMCKEYNKTLLTENSTLGEQKTKYEELRVAIQAATAEKIKAKYVEEAMAKLAENQTESTNDLKERASTAMYDTGQTQYIASPMGGGVASPVYKQSEHIRGASKALWDAVESEAIEASENLKQLTGSAYSSAFDQALERITKSVQQATGASDKEMDQFSGTLSGYLTSMVKSAKEADVVIGGVNKTLEQFYSTEPNNKTTEAIDYTSMSFGELDKLLIETQDKINVINAQPIKTDTDNTKLNELLGILGTVQSTITKNTNNLNTEAGISSRIKQLKEERENVEINSTRYNELSATIKGLEKKLPNNRDTSADELRKAEQLADKQRQAELRAEQSRIDVMEEGYEKRKAILDLQHKQNIYAIEKEQKDLLKARKDAKAGGLSESEKQGFADRIANENTSYSKDQNKLFDGEIDYKRSQYELYFRWVRNMGEDVANAQFSTLLKGGSSYKTYLENQIKELNDKKLTGTLTEGEGNQLISLNMQYDEVTGAKSAMDTFKESLTKAINQAGTLAEKIQAVADAKERLANGSTGLVGADEQAEANLFINEQESSNDQEIQERILSDFRSFEERKTAIVQEYNVLRLQKQVQDNQELLAKINQGEAEAISAVNAEQLKGSKAWSNLFTNLDSLSSAKIEQLIDGIEAQMENADLKLSPVDYNALMDTLNQAREKVVSLNPFRALGSAFGNYITALKKLRQAEKDNLTPEEIQNKQKAVKQAAAKMSESIEDITEIVGSVGSVASSLSDSFGDEELSETISNVTGAISGAGQAAGGVARIMSGDIVGGAMAVVQGIGSVITSFTKMHDAANEKKIKALQKEIDDLADSYDDLSDSIGRAYSTRKAALIEEQNSNLEQQNEAIRKQIQEEQDKKKTDQGKIDDWYDTIEENNKKIAENSAYNIAEAINGTSVSSAIDSFAEAYANAWAKGEKAAGKSTNVVKDLIKKAIIDQLKNKLAPEVEIFMQKMAEAMKDGVISDTEQQMLDEYTKKMEGISDNYLSQTGDYLLDDSAANSDSLEGAVKSMSEETGGVIAGRLNAFVINQSDQMAIARNILVYQAMIAANTKASASELKEIKDSLKRIENKDSSLLSQGIS